MLGLWLIKSYSKKLHAVTHYGSPLLAGFSVRLTIPVETSKGAVTAVPISAVSLAADGTSRVLVDRGGKQEYVTVQPGAFNGRLCRGENPRWAPRPRPTRGGGLQSSRANGSKMMLMENIRQALPIKVAAADADHVLDLRKVCKQFGTDPAVDALIDVDLVLRRGEFRCWHL